MKKESEKILKGFAEKIVNRNVDSACFYWMHQPKLPSGAKEFKNR